LWKEQFATLSQVVKPALNGDGLTFVLADISDRGYGR